MAKTRKGKALENALNVMKGEEYKETTCCSSTEKAIDNFARGLAGEELTDVTPKTEMAKIFNEIGTYAKENGYIQCKTYSINNIDGKTKYKASDGTLSDSWSSECSLISVGTENGIKFRADGEVKANISQELCSVADVKDTITYDSSTKKTYLNKNTRKITINGSEGWKLNSTSGSLSIFEIANGKADQQAKTGTVICDKFNNTTDTSSERIKLAVSKDYFTIYIAISSSKASTVSEFNTWLSNNNTTIIYQLANTITNEIDNVTIKTGDKENIKLDSTIETTYDFF